MSPVRVPFSLYMSPSRGWRSVTLEIQKETGTTTGKVTYAPLVRAITFSGCVYIHHLPFMCNDHATQQQS